MRSTHSDPEPGQLVRVTYQIHPDSPWRDFLGTVVTVRAPGEGPIIRKPGKRIEVRPLDGSTALAGWYSVNEIEVIGWDPRVLSPTSHAVLDGLAARGRRYNEYPARLSQTINWLERHGLVERRPTSDGRVAAIATLAGLETIAAWKWLGETQ
jgi:hypothetical protein